MLRQALLDAIESLKPSSELPATRHAARAYQILRLRYVEALDLSQVLDRLTISESLYYLELQRAVEGLSAVLSERWGLGESDGSAASGGRDRQVTQTAASRVALEEARPRPPTNLPVQLTSFVGREREMAEVKSLLGTNRLLTLTGTGGCGKTRLALQVASGVLDEHPDGVWLVDLAPLSDPALVPQTAASVLGIPEEPGRPIVASLADYLRPKRLLLILDNCEHLLDALAELADSLLHACPELRVVATSREALGLYGEASYRVPSLSVPDPSERISPEALERYESVRLLLDRARLVTSDFALTEQNAAAVAEICWRLDGIPLALELAAARLRGITVEQIASRLDDCFRLLTSGSRTALRRQQTLRATIDWSYDLLSAPERVLFRRLAVFSGGWSLEAAERVGSGAGDEASVEQDEVLDLLLHLVDRSLVVAEAIRGERRYRFPETIRHYALDKLADSGEAASVGDRHCGHILSVVAATWQMPAAKANRWLRERGELEHDNIRAALSRCLETDPGLGLRLGILLQGFWIGRGVTSEGRYWFRELLARAPERTAARGEALSQCGVLALDQGDLDEGASLAEEGLAIAREVGDRRTTVWALIDVADAAKLRGHYAWAREVEEEAVALSRKIGEDPLIGFSESHLGMILAAQGEYDQAQAHYERAIEARRVDELSAAWTSAMLGFLAYAKGNHERARSLLEESVDAIRESGDLSSLGWSLSLLGYVVGRGGDQDRGVALLRESLALLRDMRHGQRLGRGLCLLGVLEGDRGARERSARLIGAGTRLIGDARPEFALVERVDREASLAAAREALGEEAFARSFADGQAMTLDQAVDYALEDEELSADSATDWAVGGHPSP